MYKECTVGVFDSMDHARQALIELERLGFSHQQVSLVTYSVDRQLRDEDALQYGDKTERNAAKGAGVGGLLGLLLGAPLLAIPGLGLVLIAGPLAGGMTGAIVGGILGSMSGWGVHPNHLREYEERVRAGAILVVVNGDPRQLADAERVLAESGAVEVKLHAAAADETPEVDDRGGPLMTPPSESETESGSFR